MDLSGGSHSEYYYDVRNLLTKHVDTGSTTYTYAYDVDRRRAKTNFDGTVTNFLYDGLNVLGEYDDAATPVQQVRFLSYGLDRYVSSTMSGSEYYYHQDALGSVWSITDGSEVEQNSYEYRAYGAAQGTPSEGVANPYRLFVSACRTRCAQLNASDFPGCVDACLDNPFGPPFNLPAR